ncbi:MAG: flippase-like domain-containing protein [Bdellovibrio sp.]|nr:flippase-like domain-containing protein [Methylotenera sp.]
MATNNSLKFLLRLAATALILALIMHSINAAQVWQVLKKTRLDYLAAALLLQFGSTAVSAYRWQMIMQNLHFGQNFAFYWRSYFKGMFFNQGLPTSIGGDAVRMLDVASRGFRKRDALYGVMVDRIIGLGALLSLTLLAYLLSPDLLLKQVHRPILLIISTGALGFFGIFFIKYFTWLNRFPKLAFISIIAERLHQALSARRVLLVVASLLIPILALLGFFATGWALGLQYSLMTYFALVPPALVLTVVPISVAGWGVREGALVGLFSLIGADKTAVLMMSMLYGLTLIIVSFPGLVTYLKGRHLLKVPSL